MHLCRPLYASATILGLSISSMTPRPALAAAAPLLMRASPAEDAEAKLHYDEGVRLFENAQFEEAAREFEMAYAIVPNTNVLYNIALAWEEAGELDKALENLRAFAEQAPPDEAAEVEPNLRSLEYRIQKQQDALEASRKSEEDDDADAFLPSTQPNRDKPSRNDKTRTKPRVFTPAAGVLIGLGVAGLATGTGLAVAAKRSDDDVRQRCSDFCPSSASEAATRARNLAIGADVSFAIGGASLAAGLVLITINAVRANKRRSARTSVTPMLGQTQGLRVSTRF